MAVMKKKDIDKVVNQLLKDNTKTYTQQEIRQCFNSSLTTDQITRVYKRYTYLKTKDT